MQTGSQDAAAGGLRFSRCGNSCARLNVQTREIQRKMQRPGQEAVASSSKPDRLRHHRARGCVRSILHPGRGLGGWGADDVKSTHSVEPEAIFQCRPACFASNGLEDVAALEKWSGSARLPRARL